MIEENKPVTVKYYENDFPVENELVMVESTSCEENACYVKLLEYEGKMGMIPFNEYSKSMKKGIQRAMKIGKVEAVRVIRVDCKGYIDLSKSKVNPDEENEARDKFAKAKSVHSILIHVSETCKVDITELYKIIIWPLYKKETIHPLETLKMIMNKEERINDLGITDEQVKLSLIDEIKRRFKRPILKTISIFRITIKLFDGIGALKKVLKAGLQFSKEQGFDVKITALGAPDYLVQIQTVSKEDGEKAIMLALDRIKQYSSEIDPNSEFLIKLKPKVVGDSNAKIHQIYAEELQKEEEGQMDEQEDAQDDIVVEA